MMETWAIVTLVLGSSAISSLLTFFVTKMKLNQQNKLDSRTWRREVRGRPLLKLREELARMATELQRLVTNTQFLHNQSSIIEEAQQQALNDWRNYITSGQFLPIFYQQYDNELLNLVDQIESNYLLLFEYALDYNNLKIDERKTFREISQNVKSKIPEVQELINKRLEEL